MIELIFPDGRLRRLRDDIWHDDLETAAILLCEPGRSEDDWRLTVREMHVVPPEASLVRTATAVVVDPAFGLPIEKKARIEGLSLVYCHTHPHQTKNVAFSSIDDDAEIELAKYAEGRIPGVPHCALVFGSEAAAARRLGTRETVKVTDIQHEVAATYDRQIRAFGEEGQAALARLCLGVVGLGGTGSVVVQQLAHLGVADFLLIDPDVVETTNLNRTVGSTPKSVGEPKVSVAARMIRSIRPDARVEEIVGDVVDEGPAKRLTECDFIFCCTDSHASRHVINQLAYQYGIPAIDMGVVVVASGSAVNFAGHVKALKDDEACLWCINHLDPNQIREEMMTPDQRKSDPYVVGARVVQPAIISINSTVASAAVTMFLSMVTGLDAPARFLAFDSLSLSYRHSPTYVTDRNSLFVWLRLGEMEGESIECVEYDKTVFLKSLAQIRSLTLDRIEVFLPKIERLCAKAGVAFVVTKPVGKMSLSGVSRWLSPRKAMIQQTLRHKANDHFWFTFFHEARHVLHGSRKTVFVDGTGLEGASPEEEEEANAWSAEFLVPQAQLLKFVAAGDLSERAVRSFANELGVAAGIVVGQLQKRNYLRYGQLSSLIERCEWT